MSTYNAIISEVVEMAWCDDTSFDAIERQTGLKEKDVIKIMRGHMKPSSFRMWRERVSGRSAKHNQRSRHGERCGQLPKTLGHDLSEINKKA